VAAASIESREATEAPQTGVVAYAQMFQNALRSVTPERPPRPRLFGMGAFSWWRGHPSFTRRGKRTINGWRPAIAASEHRGFKRGYRKYGSAVQRVPGRRI